MEEKDIDLYEVVEEEDSSNVLDEEGDEGVGDDWNWEDEEEELEEVEDKMEEVKELVPETTWEFLNTETGREIAENIKKSNSPH